MRVGRQAFLGVLDANALQHCDTTLADRCGVQSGVQLERLTHLPTNRQGRVERHHRLLEYHADPRPPHLAHPLGISGIERFALKGDATAAHLHRRRQQANDSAGGHGLAAARLAHQRNDLAGGHVEAEVIDSQRTVCTDPNL